VGLVDHQARAVLLAELDDLRQVAQVALHREDAIDNHEDASAVTCGPLEHLLELRHLVVAKRAEPRAGKLAAVQDRGVIRRVADHRVARPEDRPDRARVGLMARGEDDHVLGAHPLGELALEVQVERGGAVEQARSGEPGPVCLQRLAGALLDAVVGGEPQIVVGPEHDRLAPLHLHDRAGL
jgi:hypothetical protein